MLLLIFTTATALVAGNQGDLNANGSGTATFAGASVAKARMDASGSGAATFLGGSVAGATLTCSGVGTAAFFSPHQAQHYVVDFSGENKVGESALVVVRPTNGSTFSAGQAGSSLTVTTGGTA